MHGPPKEKRRPGQEAASISKNSSSNSNHTLRAPRVQILAAHLHALGPRALHEFIVELITAHGTGIIDRLEAYRRIDPTILCALGGDRFPPRLWRVP
jgi:hypothetical protein